jgi:hypothetical protein
MQVFVIDYSTLRPTAAADAVDTAQGGADWHDIASPLGEAPTVFIDRMFRSTIKLPDALMISITALGDLGRKNKGKSPQ